MSESQRVSRGIYRHVLAGVVLTLLLTVGATAGPLEDGDAAFNRGDYATALRLLRPLAEQGNAIAQAHLGFIYSKGGAGVPSDHVEAAEWFRLAAEQDINSAQLNLGLCLFTGVGVPKDYVLAHFWFNLAGARAPDAHIRDTAVKYRDAVEAIMTPAQLAEAQRLAREWKPR